jgi:hypothetical protein
METGNLRRTAQLVLAVIAVLAAVGAVYQYLNREGGILGPHVNAVPSSGPVGMRPFFEIRGYPEDQEVSVRLCTGTSEIAECAELAKGKAGDRLRSAPIPATLPDSSDVTPGTYELRVGPDRQGGYPERGRFEVVPFAVGERLEGRPFAGVDPSSVRAGEAKEIARGAPCRPPSYLGDGRLAVGSTVVDPETGATVVFNFQALELAWSPDGSKLAMLTPDRKEIRLANADGTEATAKVREARGFLSSISWAPDSNRLAFISENDPAAPRLGPGPPTVKILNVDSGEQTAAGPGLAVAWSSRDILAVERAGAVIEASNIQGARQPLTNGRRPSWSSDGGFLAVIRSNESNVEQGWIASSDGSKSAPVAGDGVCGLSFAPDGDEIAVVRSEGGVLLVRPIEAPGAR